MDDEELGRHFAKVGQGKTFDELTSHPLCSDSFVAFDREGTAIYAGSFTYHLGDGYFLISAHRRDEDDTADDTGFDCIVSLADLSGKRADGYPTFWIFDDYQAARACLQSRDG